MGASIAIQASISLAIWCYESFQQVRERRRQAGAARPPHPHDFAHAVDSEKSSSRRAGQPTSSAGGCLASGL